DLPPRSSRSPARPHRFFPINIQTKCFLFMSPLDTHAQPFTFHLGAVTWKVSAQFLTFGDWAVRNFFDLQNVILVGEETLNRAVRFIAGCQFCSQTAELPFDYI